jgi:hypothetical protein
MLKGNGHSFLAVVTADYGDRVYSFTMDCTAYPDGTVDFTIEEPASISGICGRVSQSGGKLIFDDQVLLFDSLTSSQITPAIAPYLMVKAIQGGYIRSTANSAETVDINIDDTFRAETYQTVLVLNNEGKPVTCEIFSNHRRILSIQVINFKPV